MSYDETVRQVVALMMPFCRVPDKDKHFIEKSCSLPALLWPALWQAGHAVMLSCSLEEQSNYNPHNNHNNHNLPCRQAITTLTTFTLLRHHLC